MNRTAALLLALALGCFPPRAARADEVVLVGGGTIENVRVTVEGDAYRLSRAQGSSLIPMSEVKKVVYSATLQDQLAAKKLEAGHDARKLREVAAWAGSRGLKADRDELVQVARAIELDQKLAALDGSTNAAPYLDLAESMKVAGYSAAEQQAVIRRAVAVEPENAEARRAHGETKRDGRWVTFADAKKAIVARAAAAAAAEEARVLAAKREAAKLEQARLEAEVARLEQEKADREEAIRQERLAANEKIWADRQQAQDDLYRLQAQRDALLYQQRWRTRRIVTVVDSCTPVYRPTTIYRPTTACPPSRPTTTVMVRVLAPRQTTTPQPAPQRSSGISPSNPNLNWHPAWNKTGAPPMNRR